MKYLVNKSVEGNYDYPRLATLLFVEYCVM